MHEVVALALQLDTLQTLLQRLQIPRDKPDLILLRLCCQCAWILNTTNWMTLNVADLLDRETVQRT